MMLSVIGLIVIFNVGAGNCDLLPLIENVICSADSANITECIIKAVETINEPVIAGDYGDGIKGIVLDPYELDKLEVNRGPNFKTTLKNVIVTGFKNFQIENLRADLSKKKFIVSFNVPDLVVRGQYKLNMNILLMKLEGNGPFNLTDDLQLKVLVEFKADKQNMIQLKQVKLDVEFVNPQLYLGNLFRGDPTLEAIGNEAINANPDILLDELKPELEQHLEESITETVSTITQGATADELFPGF